MLEYDAVSQVVPSVHQVVLCNFFLHVCRFRVHKVLEVETELKEPKEDRFVFKVFALIHMSTVM